MKAQRFDAEIRRRDRALLRLLKLAERLHGLANALEETVSIAVAPAGHRRRWRRS